MRALLLAAALSAPALVFVSQAALAAPVEVVGPGGPASGIVPVRPGVPPTLGRPLRPRPLPGRSFGAYGAGFYGAGLFGAGGFPGYGGYGDFYPGLFGSNGPRDIHDLDITRGSAVQPGAAGNYRSPVGAPMIYAVEGRGPRGRSLRACGVSSIPLGGGEEGYSSLTRVSLC